MALVNCPECNHEVSSQAKKCPNCGYKLPLSAERRKKKKRTVIFIVLFVCLAVIGFGSYYAYSTYFKPMSVYRQAEELLVAKEYDAAVDEFTKVIDFKDSSERIKESTYSKASDMLAEGLNDEAKEIFTGLADYADSSDMVLECDYQKALMFHEKGKLNEAIALFDELADYSDAERKAKECRFESFSQKYEDTSKWYDSDRMKEAFFNNVFKYRDLEGGETYKLQKVYEIGLLYLEDGEGKEALKYLEDIVDYADTRDVIERAILSVVNAYFEDKNYSMALSFSKRYADKGYEYSQVLYEDCLAKIWNEADEHAEKHDFEEALRCLNILKSEGVEGAAEKYTEIEKHKKQIASEQKAAAEAKKAADEAAKQQAAIEEEARILEASKQYAESLGPANAIEGAWKCGDCVLFVKNMKWTYYTSIGAFEHSDVSIVPPYQVTYSDGVYYLYHSFFEKTYSAVFVDGSLRFQLYVDNDPYYQYIYPSGVFSR